MTVIDMRWNAKVYLIGVKVYMKLLHSLPDLINIVLKTKRFNVAVRELL